MKSFMRKLLFCLLALVFHFFAGAQSGTLDPTFNPTDPGFGAGDGATGIVRAFLPLSDGKMLIGGDFFWYNGSVRNQFARINENGTVDATFNSGSGFNSGVAAMVQQSDGKIVIGGGFTSYKGVTCNKIVRLNTDGSIDATFNTGTGFTVPGFASCIVYSLALQSDGKIVVGGEFTHFNGTSRNRIARLNADGSLDATFNPGTGAVARVNSVALQSTGKIVIGGDFTVYNGTIRNYVARLNTDGSLDATFNADPTTGANNIVYKLVLQNDDKIVIGGHFTGYNGATRNRVARLNADGTLDASFNPGTGASSTVLSLAVQSDNKVVIGGHFTSYNGATRSRIARINTDGSIDGTFDPGTGANDYITNIFINSDGRILIGGEFKSYNNSMSYRIARVNADGSLDATFNSSKGGVNTSYASTPGVVSSMLVQSDNKILIGGFFDSYNGVGRNYFARLNVDGTLDATFNTGTGPNHSVKAMVQQNDGKTIIGGGFYAYNDIMRSNLARVNTDGSLDLTFSPTTGPDGSVYAIALQSDGKILIGGSFTSYNGTSRNYIARVNTDGSLDATFNPGSGANGTVNAIAVQSDGKILIAGDFTSYNGTARTGVARLNANGSLDVTFSSGASSSVIS
jgi:uncharacterized delta-60 repeat protein